jgi:DNA replication and repair protein RecF
VKLGRIEVRDLRNIEYAEVELSPGLNVFVGRNAQGKTSLLEAVGLIARGRSFRTDATRTLIRRGSQALVARGFAAAGGDETRLEVEVTPDVRRLRVDGHDVAPHAYHGRLDVVVYATDRLRVIRGPMRERRGFLDRGAAALWPSYRHTLRDYARVLRQRNAALESAQRGLEAWDERLIETGARLRHKRGEYVARLDVALGQGYRARGESYALRLRPPPPLASEDQARAGLARELEAVRGEERHRRRSLAGPHRDEVLILVDGEDAAQSASSGQARSVLLALTLAAAEIYRAERGQAATLLLDDLDSELDEERTRDICEDVAQRAQALVTTAHPAWAERLDGIARRFQVDAGQVVPA